MLACILMLAHSGMVWMNNQFSLSIPIDKAWIDIRDWLLVACVFIALGKCVYEALVWKSREYYITSQAVTATRGVIARTTVSIALSDVRQIVVDSTPGERVLRLGTVLLSSAGSHRIDVAYVNVTKPNAIAAAVRDAMKHNQSTQSNRSNNQHVYHRAVVIGLVGGIGSGKSTVAGMLAELGCIVVDADKNAKEALDLPRVRDELVKWWGPRILNSQGMVDRKSIANIVFSDVTQRSRLESLVHPIVKSTRAELIGRATLEGKPGVVIDAPLLFEAGSDKECDAVLFVDCPYQQRLARIASRGWSEQELQRREAAQLPLEEKKTRSTQVIVNDAGLDELRGRVQTAFANITQSVLAKQAKASNV